MFSSSRSWACPSSSFLLTPPPVVWSSSSLILTPHPSQPIIHARHFSSSIQFRIPSPVAILAASEAYGPPEVISTSPCEDRIFAYFPGRGADGLACVWKKGTRIDVWTVQDCWSIGRGKGIVSAEWVGGPRQLYLDASGSIERLPFRGPQAPTVAGPILLLVNQTHYLSLCYYRIYASTMTMINCLLSEAGPFFEGRPTPMEEQKTGTSVRLCTKASIGLGYNESSIFVATRSRVYPCSPQDEDTLEMMDLDDLGITTQSTTDSTEEGTTDAANTSEWDPWGEEEAVLISKVKFSFDGMQIGLLVEPLNPIFHPAPHVSRIQFLSTPPVEETSEQVYLAVTYFDFGDYSVPPTSDLVLYTMSRVEGENRRWLPQRESTRSFPNSVVDFVMEAPSRTSVYVALLDTSGPIPSSRSGPKEGRVGSIVALKLPSLEDAENFEPSVIKVPVSLLGRHLPMGTAPSPNATLLATSYSCMAVPQIYMQSLPRRKPLTIARCGTTPVPSLSLTYALALLSRQPTDDIAHILAQPLVPRSELTETLYYALQLCEGRTNGLHAMMTFEALGGITEAYRQRARFCQDQEEKELSDSCWKVAHDVCSLSACNRAFDDCKDNDEYDKNAIWQLVGLSSWVVSFVERLVKECVNSCSLQEILSSAEDDTSGLERLSPRLSTPMLLYLAQPFALINFHTLLENVRKFRAFLDTSLSDSSAPQRNNENLKETLRLARATLNDSVECSGIDLEALGKVLMEGIKELKTIGVDEGRRGLASCQPTQTMKPAIYKIIKQLLDPSKVNKFQLFVKASDLVDQVSTLSIQDTIHGDGNTSLTSPWQRKDRKTDTVLKANMTAQSTIYVCLRCGGHSQVSSDVVKGTSLKWMAWERMWARRCICGGPWASPTVM